MHLIEPVGADDPPELITTISDYHLGEQASKTS